MESVSNLDFKAILISIFMSADGHLPLTLVKLTKRFIYKKDDSHCLKCLKYIKNINKADILNHCESLNHKGFSGINIAPPSLRLA